MINSSTRLIPDGVCILDPLEELSILGNMLFRSIVSLKGYSAGLSWETCSYYSLKLTGKDDILKCGRLYFCMYSFRTRC